MRRTNRPHSGIKNGRRARGVNPNARRRTSRYASRYTSSNRPGSDVIQITRRQLIGGAIGIAAVAMLGGTAFTVATCSRSDSGGSGVLSVPQSSVFTTEDCEYLENPEDVFELALTASLPLGTMVWVGDDSTAVCLIPTDTGKPLTKVGLLSLGNGELTTIIDRAVGQDEGFEIYDARATSSGVVWVEADILDGNWRVYHAPINNLVMGTPVLADEGGVDWEMPSLAACGSYAFWQVLPNLNGAAIEEDSVLMRSPFGASADAAQAAYVSSGRFACAPTSSATGIACVPRADIDGTYYQLTHIDANSGQITDSLVLPSSMKPSDVSYGNTGFSFCFDGIYAYGDGISNLGTYTPAASIAYNVTSATNDAATSTANSRHRGDTGKLSEAELKDANRRGTQTVADLYSASEWFRFPRAPVVAPAWCNQWLMVKSSNAVAGVDLASRRYFTFDVESGAPNYGEFLAMTGTHNRVVTFTQIDYTPINGSSVKECRVKVWRPR